MIRKIILENFMAHAMTEIELDSGVTALTGPNNTGKSAVVEALRCVASNPAPRHFIRHGAREARVTVELDDGTRVVWIRKKRSPGYELWKAGAEEPEEFWKLGRGKVPEEIREALRLDAVELENGGRDVDVHVGNQREPVFLLNRPDSDTAAFFAASTESAHLLAMQNALKRRTQEARREEQRLEQRRVEVEADLDALALLPDINLVMERARECRARLDRLGREIPALEQLLARRGSLVAELEKRNRIAEVLDGVTMPPDTAPTRGLDDLLGRMERVGRGLDHARNVRVALDSLAPLPQPGSTQPLARFLEHMTALQSALQTAKDRKAPLQELLPVPELPRTGQLSGLVDEMLALQCRMHRLKRQGAALGKIAEPPVPTADGGLDELARNLASLRATRNRVQDELVGVDAELAGVRAEVERAVERMGKCPTCGRDMTASDLLDRGGCHD